MVSIVKISDGLWNQMFQYAFARFLEEKKHEDVVLDIGQYQVINKDRKFQLDVFNTKYTVATYKDIPFYTYQQFKNKIFWAIKKIKWLHSVFFAIWEWQVDDFILSHKYAWYTKEWPIKNSKLFNNMVYYSWYRQSEKFFPGIREELLKEFTLKSPLDKKNQDIIDLMHTTNAVSLHVRRGDYTSRSITRNYYLFPCKIEYFIWAIDKIQQQVKDPEFFVFSDDMDRVKSHIHVKNIHYIDWNRWEESYKDLRLMSQCKHNIIANSSFSRWWAWLNQHKNKMVIYPRHWFSTKSMNTWFNTVLPNDWIWL